MDVLSRVQDANRMPTTVMRAGKAKIKVPIDLVLGKGPLPSWERDDYLLLLYPQAGERETKTERERDFVPKALSANTIS
jgi:hypothetical protein